MAEWTGQTIGKVRIETYLARGGMAEVFLGTHLTLDRHVAVKFMHSHVESEPDLLTRFQREAKAVAGLRHPNIVQVFDFDTYEGHPYIVMEYINGPSLATYLRELHKNGGRLTLKQVAQLLKPLAEGLDYAHSQGIIHRDIKPANIILSNKSAEFSPDKPLPADTTCVITDFGLVRIANSVNQTASGVVSGTPAYMSPEQAQGNSSSVDHRTDIYSLTVVLYEMIAGRPPFDGDSTLGVILKHISEPPPPIEDASPEIQAVVSKGLEKLAENRYRSAHELLAEFYKAIGMHSEAETVHSLRFKTPPPPVSQTQKAAPRRNNLLWIGAGIIACLCFGVFLTSALGLSIFALRATPTPEIAAPDLHGTHSPSTQEAGTNPGIPIQVDPSNVLRFQGELDQVTVSGSFQDPAEGFQYEAWLIDDTNEVLTSIGILKKGASGLYTLTYLDPEGRNLLNVYNRMEITLEAIPDPSPNPAEIAYSSAIPSGALIHIRHILGSFNGNPNQTAMTIGLLDTSTLIDDAGILMATAHDDGNDKAVRANAEAMINLIVGSQSGDFKDWDKNGKVENPGDGFGLLLNGGQSGYIEGTITHAELAAGSGDASENIIFHSEHVAISGKNVEEWAAQLRDVAKRILESAPGQISEADVRLAVSLAEQIHKGIDLDGNESVDPVAGEGGAATAYEHAEYMADMQILEGENQLPPPASP